MKKLVVLLTVLGLIVGSQAFAITDTGANSLGVYFDVGDFDENCIEPPYLVPFQMYFVMANCTQPSIGGFEFAWRIEPDPGSNLIVMAHLLPLHALNIGDIYNLIVGLGTPLQTSPGTVLVEFTLFSLNPDLGGHITVGPVTPASIPGHTAFIDGEDYDILLPMNYSTLDGEFVTLDEDGWVNPGVGTFTCPGPVAVEQAPWGSVKALFK